jgi:hypothetical protein
MPTIMQLLERKRLQEFGGESERTFATRLGFFPSQYTRAKKSNKIPRKCIQAVALTLGMDAYEVQGRSRSDPKLARFEEQEADLKITELHRRLVNALVWKLRNPSVALLLERHYVRPDITDPERHQQGCLQFSTLMDALRVDMGLERKNGVGSIEINAQIVRPVIDQLARDEEEKLAMAIFAFPACDFVYSKEEMPELHRRCGRF